MAVNGPYPVDSVALFPGGLYAVGEVSRCTEFGSPRDNPVQLRDKVTGQPMWQFDVMDADPEARKNVRMFRVKIPAVVAPVDPEVLVVLLVDQRVRSSKLSDRAHRHP